MDRRELLKYMPAMGGAVIVGSPERMFVPEFGSNELENQGRKYRIVVQARGDDPLKCDVQVYDHATGAYMEWEVTEFTYRVNLDNRAVVELRYMTADEKTGAVKLTPLGFVMSQVFEGSAVAP